MARFLLGVTKLGQNPHVQCFMDHVRAMAAALRTLGHEAEYASEEALKRGGRLILWGANQLVEDPNASKDPKHLQLIPPDAIVFQAEQVSAIAEPTYFIQSWLQYRNFSVWDYAESNVKALKHLGIDRAVLCPLGYHPSMTMIEPAADQDIDVLFYGSSGGRRRDILAALNESDMHVVCIGANASLFGKERDAFIARAKVVLNLHYYERGIFEIFRCSHLFANRVCVVNEAGGRDAGLEDLAQRCTAYTPREHLIERCREMVESPHRRLMIAEQAFEEFKKIDLAENVRAALAAS